MSELVPITDERSTAFNNILRFYEKSDIVLTAEEDKILSRWDYCDALLKQRKFKSSAIVDMIREKFGVSQFTAQGDIKQTYALFGLVRVISKQYILAHSIESIQIRIQQWESDKSLSHLVPKLYAELTKMLAQLPDEIAKEKLAPVVMVFNSVAGQESPAMGFEEAQALKAQRAKTTTDFTDFEDVATNE